MSEAELWAMFAAHALGKRKACVAAETADTLLTEYKKRYHFKPEFGSWVKTDDTKTKT